MTDPDPHQEKAVAPSTQDRACSFEYINISKIGWLVDRYVDER